MKKPVHYCLGCHPVYPTWRAGLYDLSVISASSLIAGQELFVSVITESSNEQNGGGGDKNQYHQSEHFIGTFQCSLILPGPVKESVMTTEYRNGVFNHDYSKSLG